MNQDRAFKISAENIMLDLIARGKGKANAISAYSLYMSGYVPIEPGLTSIKESDRSIRGKVYQVIKFLRENYPIVILKSFNGYYIPINKDEGIEAFEKWYRDAVSRLNTLSIMKKNLESMFPDIRGQLKFKFTSESAKGVKREQI